MYLAYKQVLKIIVSNKIKIIWKAPTERSGKLFNLIKHENLSYLHLKLLDIFLKIWHDFLVAYRADSLRGVIVHSGQPIHNSIATILLEKSSCQPPKLCLYTFSVTIQYPLCTFCRLCIFNIHMRCTCIVYIDYTHKWCTCIILHGHTHIIHIHYKWCIDVILCL